MNEKIIAVLYNTEDGAVSVGTGFFFGDCHHVITSAHNYTDNYGNLLFKEGDGVLLRYNEEIIEGTLLKISVENDIAIIILFDNRYRPFYPYKSAVSIRQDILSEPITCKTVGITPYLKYNKYNNAYLSCTGRQNGKLTLEHANAIRRGFSGAPLIVNANTLLGVICSYESSEDGRAINVSYAIPIDKVCQLIDDSITGSIRIYDENARWDMKKEVRIYMGRSISFIPEFVNGLKIFNHDLNNLFYSRNISVAMEGVQWNQYGEQTSVSNYSKYSHAYFVIGDIWDDRCEAELEALLSEKNNGVRLHIVFVKGKGEDERVKLLKTKLAEEDIVFRTCSSVEELKLYTVLDLIAASDIPFDNLQLPYSYLENGRVLIDYKEVSVLQTNEKYVGLCKKKEELLLLQSTMDSVEDRKRVANQITTVSKEINEVEDRILQLLLNISDAESRKITPLLKSALIYIDTGQVEEALQIMNLHDIYKEKDGYVKRADAAIEGIKSAIHTMRTTISLLNTREETLLNNKKIESLEETIIALETKYNIISFDACVLAFKWLKKNDYRKGINYLKLYLEQYETGIERSYTPDEWFRELNICEGVVYYLAIILGIPDPMTEKRHVLETEIEEKDIKEELEQLFIELSLHTIHIATLLLDNAENPEMSFLPQRIAIICKYMINYANGLVGASEQSYREAVSDAKVFAENTLLKMEDYGYHEVNMQNINPKKYAEDFVSHLELQRLLKELRTEPEYVDCKTYLEEYLKKTKAVLESESARLLVADAKKHFIDVMEKLEAALRTEDPYSMYMNAIYFVYAHAESSFNNAEFDTSKKCCNRLIDICKKALNIAEEDMYCKHILQFAYTTYCKAQILLKEKENIREYMSEAVRIAEETKEKLGLPDTFVCKTYIIYGSVLILNHERDWYSEAITQFMKVCDIYGKCEENLTDEDAYNYICACNSICKLMYEHGDTDGTLKYGKKTYELMASNIALFKEMPNLLNDIKELLAILRDSGYMEDADNVENLLKSV